MPDRRVFVTGAAGFIGSHITEQLLEEGFEVMALKKNSSNLWRCEGFIHSIHWIAGEDWKEQVIEFKPDTIIHLAWNGISPIDREDFEKQFFNLQLLFDLIEIAKIVSLKKFIAFGSQAEYGSIEGRISESTQPAPINAYGVAKLAAQKSLEISCAKSGIHWYWLRIYSIFGPKEDVNWFIPMIVTKLLKDEECKLTGCEQLYDYLYVKDLAKMVLTIINKGENYSGVYNLSSNHSKSLKSIVSEINEIIKSKSIISFGAVPYRQNQSMHMEANSERYNKTFGEHPVANINSALRDTVAYYSSLPNRENQ
jgi:nucleoside-diphosphate-sugar epimerase